MRPRSIRSETNGGRGQRVGRDEDAVPNSVSVAPWDVKYICVEAQIVAYARALLRIHAAP